MLNANDNVCYSMVRLVKDWLSMSFHSTLCRSYQYLPSFLSSTHNTGPGTHCLWPQFYATTYIIIIFNSALRSAYFSFPLHITWKRTKTNVDNGHIKIQVPIATISRVYILRPNMSYGLLNQSKQNAWEMIVWICRERNEQMDSNLGWMQASLQMTWHSKFIDLSLTNTFLMFNGSFLFSIQNWLKL